MNADGAREYEKIRYDRPAPGVARILLDRPESRNAQDKRMTYELNAAFDRVAFDDEVVCAILGATGPHFSSGRRAVLRPDGSVRRERRRVFRTPLGARCAQGEGVALHRRCAHRRGVPPNPEPSA